MLGSIQPHLFVCGGEDLHQDDLGVDVMGKIQGRNDELHQVVPVVGADAQEST